jgi:hypothetical protein
LTIRVCWPTKFSRSRAPGSPGLVRIIAPSAYQLKQRVVVSAKLFQRATVQPRHNPGHNPGRQAQLYDRNQCAVCSRPAQIVHDRALHDGRLFGRRALAGRPIVSSEGSWRGSPSFGAPSSWPSLQRRTTTPRSPDDQSHLPPSGSAKIGRAPNVAFFTADG